MPLSEWKQHHFARVDSNRFQSTITENSPKRGIEFILLHTVICHFNLKNKSKLYKNEYDTTKFSTTFTEHYFVMKFLIIKIIKSLKQQTKLKNDISLHTVRIIKNWL